MNDRNQAMVVLMRTIAKSMSNVGTNFHDVDKNCEPALRTVSLLADAFEKDGDLPPMPELRAWTNAMQEYQIANRKFQSATIRVIDRAEMLAEQYSGTE